MGGRIHGFLGGVLLTTAGAYYTSNQFKKNQEFVSQTLKETEDIITNRHNPKVPIPRTIEFEYRPSWRETIADLWDEEILKSVNWIYSFNLEKSTSNVISTIQESINKIK